MSVVPTMAALTAATPYTKFNAPLNTQYDEAASKSLGYDVWRITQSFKFYVGPESDDRWVYVPAGYLSDGASVPRIFWGLLPPWGTYGQAAVVHDLLCETATVYREGVPEMISRAKTDSIFKEAMIALNVPRWKRNVMYIAVRVFSKAYHRIDAQRDPAKEKLQAAWQPA